MKIAGGEYKGRIIKVPHQPGLRPTTEKIREAVFSILGEDISDARVADLFCGSGAMGLEAISRGAQSAVFIDSSPQAISTTRQNIRTLGLEAVSRVFVLNVMSLRKPHLENIDIVFADPPYNKGYADDLLTLLSLPKLGWRGIIVLEHEAQWQYGGSEFRLAKRAEFSDKAVTFLLPLEQGPASA